MAITQDNIHHLQNFMELLLKLSIIQGSIHYEVTSDIFKPSRYTIVGIRIEP